MSKLVMLDDASRDLNTVLTVVTFDPHPRDIINPGADGIKLLSTLPERCELLADLGINEMIVIPFDRDFSLLTSEEFIRDVIYKKIGVKEFIIGYDHQFGKDREGTIETVRSLGEELGFQANVISRQEVENQTVSSTSIRKALQVEGDAEKAAKFLGRYYILHGTVVHGEKRGGKIGFPTANVHVDQAKKIIPRKGVYAVWIRVDGDYHPAMMNIGKRPTFDREELTVEVHIFDFKKDIYGKEVHTQFVRRLRNEKKFSGADQLKKQLEKGKADAKKILKSNPPNIAKQDN